MKPKAIYIVSATVPERIAALKEIAYNYWWAWNYDAQDLFVRIDKELWEDVNHNPVMLLNKTPIERFVQAIDCHYFCLVRVLV